MKDENQHNDAYMKAKRAQVVRLAKALLRGQIGIIEGSRELCSLKLAIPCSLLQGHRIEGRVRETAGFSDEYSSLIPRQLATG